jgi:hypothetical protein
MVSGHLNKENRYRVHSHLCGTVNFPRDHLQFGAQCRVDGQVFY